MSRRNQRTKVWAVCLVALVLMFIRVDLWWWGEDLPPVILGVMNWPMLYQILIWAAGWALTVYAVETLGLEREGGED